MLSDDRGEDWTVATAMAHLAAIIAANDRRYLELIASNERRYAELIDANDKRYSERFEGQEKSVNIALQAAEKAVNAALTAAEKAVSKAEISTEDRLKSMSEFRETIEDQRQAFLPRQEAGAEFSGINQTLSNLSSRMDRNEGHGIGGKDLSGYMLAGVLLLISVISLFWKATGK